MDAVASPELTQLQLGYRWSRLSRNATSRSSGPRPGDRAPDAPCGDPFTGTPKRLFDLFRGPHFVLLGLGERCATALNDLKADIVKPYLIGPAGLIDDAGRYKPGDRLPSTLELMERTGGANLTVRGAYRVLVEEGLVESVSKKGFYVRRPNAMTWRMNPPKGSRRSLRTSSTGGPPMPPMPDWHTGRISASRSRTPRCSCWAPR